ncbi:Ger(x)C family spore germination protein [Heyndrickxia sp. MSNUG]|uniref:Ger(x)C family spore germination protein n=1 Tax=Heyndrickxia sp. MSNUG TaxID=3136677 RepID=UPI003C2DB335
MRVKKLIPFFALSLLLTGCVEKEIIDDVNIETGIGYDLAEDNNIEGTVMVPVFKPDKNIGNFTFSAKAKANRDLMQEIQRKSAQPVATGSLEIAVFGEEMAKKGIIELMDSFERDPSIGARIYLAVADGKAKDILSGTYGNRGNAIHLSELIKHNTKDRNLPETNLHLFFFNHYQKGSDPYLPILKKVETDIIDIVGVAVFKNGHMVHTIPADRMFFFKLLTDKFSMGNFQVKVGKDLAAIKDLGSKHKFKLDKRNPYTVTIEINIEGIIREYTGKMLTPPIIKKIQKELEEEVNEQCSAMIADFQEHEVDPLSLGNFIKSKTRGFDYKKWEDDYKNITVHVKTHVKITEVGVVE